MIIKSLLFIFFISSSNVLGDSLYNFENIKDEERFYSLIKEIRCPKCTSGSLASSNAPVSEANQRFPSIWLQKSPPIGRRLRGNPGCQGQKWPSVRHIFD